MQGFYLIKSSYFFDIPFKNHVFKLNFLVL